MPRRCLKLAETMAAVLADSESEDDKCPEICILAPENGTDTDVEDIDGC